MHWTPHLTVAAVIERDQRYLLVEELIQNQLTLNQPAGHVEAGESLQQAVIREVLEETAWEFVPEALVGIYRWHRAADGETFFRFCFSGRLEQHHPQQALDPDIANTVWMSSGELLAQPERYRSPLVGRCLSDYLAGHRFPLAVLGELG